MGGKTPRRHFHAEREFLILFSGGHLHPGQYCPDARQLVVPAVSKPRPLAFINHTMEANGRPF
jgi:hypothetical protein